VLSSADGQPHRQVFVQHKLDSRERSASSTQLDKVWISRNRDEKIEWYFTPFQW
jgi:hypothetical protein